MSGASVSTATTNSLEKKACVIGAGIGGLACAIALQQRGWAVSVLEQTPEIREVGAGIQISPNGARVLSALSVPVPGMRSEAVHLKCGLSDRSLLRMALSDDPGFWLCHRADLIAALEQQARDVGAEIKLAAQVTEIEPEQGSVTLANGQRLTADLIIGADGLHAVSRKTVLGESAPFFTGQVAWRAIAANVSHPPEAQVHVAPGTHIVTYPLRNQPYTNIVAVEERDDWTAEGWHHEGDLSAFKAQFAGFAPALQDLLGSVEQVHVWGLFRHPIAARWHKGHLALLGDAAHPTLPFLAQGAVMALEDAWVLADQVCRKPLHKALETYQSLRQHRVTQAINAANENARNYHLTGVSRWAAHKALRLINTTAPQTMLKRYSWLYDHDVTALAEE